MTFVSQNLDVNELTAWKILEDVTSDFGSSSYESQCGGLCRDTSLFKDAFCV
jgi:hypothetical protein